MPMPVPIMQHPLTQAQIIQGPPVIPIVQSNRPVVPLHLTPYFTPHLAPAHFPTPVVPSQARIRGDEIFIPPPFTQTGSLRSTLPTRFTPRLPHLGDDVYEVEASPSSSPVSTERSRTPSLRRPSVARPGSRPSSPTRFVQPRPGYESPRPIHGDVPRPPGRTNQDTCNSVY